MSENANPDSGSANDAPLTLAQATMVDFDDSQEDTQEATEEQAETETSDAEAETSEESEDETPEEDEGEGAEDEESDAKPEPVEADEAHLVTLHDGSKVPVKELKLGYLRDADYRRKTTAVAERSRGLEAINQRVSGITDALVDFFDKAVPEMPDARLAMGNKEAQEEYIRQRALHEQAMSNVQKIIELGTQAKGTKQELTEEQLQAHVATEEAKLLAKIPDLKNPAKRNEISRKALEVAAHVGFTAQEVSRNPDHRFYLLARLAAQGMAAEKAKQTAKAKVQAAPPMQPTPKPAQRGVMSKQIANKKAMSRLAQTGSIKDALQIDFE